MQHSILSLLVLVLSTTLARAARFSVHDNRARSEISEATDLYIDDRLVASFHLDDQHEAITLAITVAGGRDRSGHEAHRYALCGTITVRNDIGGHETHVVDTSGLLPDPDGHHFEALGAGNFTRFFLSDPSDPTAVQPTDQPSGLCRQFVS